MFLASLGYLPDPHADPSPITGWVTVSGDAGSTAGSAATDSSVTTDGDGDGIAAGFNPGNLTDDGFIRLSGTVTLNRPLAGGNFRVGLFHGTQPVATGEGTGTPASGPEPAARSSPLQSAPPVSTPPSSTTPKSRRWISDSPTGAAQARLSCALFSRTAARISC